MKHLKSIVIIAAMALVTALSSCGSDPTSITYDETLLYGEWVEGTVHDTYLEDGSGYSWDTSEDVTEEEASPFQWTLNSDQLTVMHILWNGSVVPKVYTVRVLDSERLVYGDAYGDMHEYQRVKPAPDPE